MNQYTQQPLDVESAESELKKSFIQDPVLIAVLYGLSIGGEKAWKLVLESRNEDPEFLPEFEFRFVSAVRFMWKLGVTIQTPEATNRDNWVAVTQGIIDRTDQTTAERIPFVYQYLVQSMIKYVLTSQDGCAYKIPTWYDDRYDMTSDLQQRYVRLHTA